MRNRHIQADPIELKATRQKHGLTQQQLVDRLNDQNIKIGLRKLQKIEKDGLITETDLQSIAELLDANYDSFLWERELPWFIPKLRWDREIHSPGTLLRPETAIVPFRFRHEEIKRLEHWRDSSALLQLQLIYGKGGIGKTRIALQFCELTMRKYWLVGFVQFESFDHEKWASALAQPDPLLLVLDYAEIRQDQIASLIREIGRARKSAKTRILLLARSDGDWWTQLQSNRLCGDFLAGSITQQLELAPVSITAKERELTYHDAWNAFAKRLGIPASPKQNVDLSGLEYERVLLIHMRALVTLFGCNPKDENDILTNVYRREQRFWRERLAALGLDASLHFAIEQAMAAITAIQGVRTHYEGYALLRHLPSLEGRSADVCIALNELLHQLYPGTDLWIEPIRPDLLGTELVSVAFDRCPPLEKLVISVTRKAANSQKRK